MQLTQSFQIARPLPEVWTALTDLAVVAECFPGAELVGADPDGTHHGKMTVRLGSIAAAFDGTAKMTVEDEEERRVLLEAEGGGTQGGVVMRLRGHASETPSGTEISLVTDIDLTGRIAQLGHGAAGAVTERLITQLATELERRLSGAPPATGAASSLSLLEMAKVAAPALRRDPRTRAAAIVAAGVLAGAAAAALRRRTPVPARSVVHVVVLVPAPRSV
jgi:uncharacterized protein